MSSVAPTTLTITTSIAAPVLIEVYVVDAASGMGLNIGSTTGQSTVTFSLPSAGLPTSLECRVCVTMTLFSSTTPQQFIQITAFPNTTVYWPSSAAPSYVLDVQLVQETTLQVTLGTPT